MLRPVKQKKIITPADLPFGHGDGVFESGAAGAAAKPLSCAENGSLTDSPLIKGEE